MSLFPSQFPFRWCFGRLFSSSVVAAPEAEAVVLTEAPEEVVPVAEISISSAPAKAKALLVGSATPAPKETEEIAEVEVEVASEYR